MAQKNMLVIILRVLSIVLLVLLLIQLGLIYDDEIFKIYNVFTVVGDLRDIFAYILYIMLFGIFMGLFAAIYFMIVGVMSVFNVNVSNFLYAFVYDVFQKIVGRWFYFPMEINSELEDPATYYGSLYEILSSPTYKGYLESPDFNTAMQGLLVELKDASSNFYIVFLQLLVIFMFFFAIRASITSNPADSIKVVTILNVLIIIPMFFNQIYIVFTEEIYLISGEVWPQFLLDIFNADLLEPEIFVDIKDLSIIEFLTSEIFLVGLSIFIYLEFVFQLAYVQQVTTPSLERERRLSRQIEIMHEEAKKAIDRIKQVEEKKREQKQKEREELMTLSEEERQRMKEDQEKLSLSSLMSETGEKVGFSYVAELIRKKKEEKKEQKLMDAMRDTRKVANYLDKLFDNDPKARDQITARTAAPKAAQLVRATILNMLSRIIIITVLTWICIHPYQVFHDILNSPAAIANSVELYTYESVLSLLIPLILIIPLISNIIRITKHSKLQEILRQEEIRRLGITEAEYEELLKERKKAAEEDKEDITMARDKDAMAEESKRQQKISQYQ